MEKFKLNETPVRTSRNFNINNITLEDVEIPENTRKFESVTIENMDCEISENVQNTKFVYGLGEILEKIHEENANSKIQVIAKKKNSCAKIIYEFDEDDINLIDNIEIIAEKDCNVIIEYKANTNKVCCHSSKIKAITKENAKLNVTIVNLLNENSNNFIAIQNEFEKNAEVHYVIVDIGGKNSITNYFSNITGENAKNTLKTIYLGQDEQIKDLNYIAELRGIKTNVDIDVQGALNGKSKKHFKGTINFLKGAKKAKGNENEYCMLLSDSAKSIALPMLLCTEDDVEGNHSTASGKADKGDLFYIMSRGFSYKEAIKLIVKTRFNGIIENIKDEEIKEEVINEIDRRLD